MNTNNIWQSSLSDAVNILNKFTNDKEQILKCSTFSDILINAYKKNANVFIAGNGGSHCDALHFAEELTGRFRKDRKPLGALALGDAAHTTCVANDYGFEMIFSRQLDALARDGDVFIGLSTSGNSKNIINAVNSAKNRNIKTVALLGRDGGQITNLADLSIIVDGDTSDRIQEVHIKILHIVIETIERELFAENY